MRSARRPLRPKIRHWRPDIPSGALRGSGGPLYRWKVSRHGTVLRSRPVGRDAELIRQCEPRHRQLSGHSAPERCLGAPMGRTGGHRAAWKRPPLNGTPCRRQFGPRLLSAAHPVLPPSFVTGVSSPRRTSRGAIFLSANRPDGGHGVRHGSDGDRSGSKRQPTRNLVKRIMWPRSLAPLFLHRLASHSA